MASYLRPRRGKKSTAESQALVLKRGEVFFECPDTGVGTGAGKLKVGDGSTAYSSLPYFMEATNVEQSTIGFTDTSTATDSSNNPTYLTNIKPANSLKTIFTNLKQLLYNYNSQLTQLNNDKTQLYFEWVTLQKYSINTFRGDITVPSGCNIKISFYTLLYSGNAWKINYIYNDGYNKLIALVKDGVSIADGETIEIFVCFISNGKNV